MKFKLAALMVLTAFVVISCSRKNIAAKNEEAKPAPLTYTANVKSIIQSKCTPCHIPEAGGKKKALDTYAAVKENLDDIIRRIELDPHEKGFMPVRKPALPAEEIAAIKAWKSGGITE